MPSMMAPTVVLARRRGRARAGQRGLQPDPLGDPADDRRRGRPRAAARGDAVEAPRLHFEAGVVYAEPGIDLDGARRRRAHARARSARSTSSSAGSRRSSATRSTGAADRRRRSAPRRRRRRRVSGVALALTLGAAVLHAAWNLLLARAPRHRGRPPPSAAARRSVVAFAPVAVLAGTVERGGVRRTSPPAAALELAYFAAARGRLPARRAQRRLPGGPRRGAAARRCWPAWPASAARSARCRSPASC